MGMKEFIPNTLGVKIRARNGVMSDFAGIAYMGDVATSTVAFTNGKSLTCSENHRFVTPRGRVALSDLSNGDSVYRRDGRLTRVKTISSTGLTEPVYDIIEVREGHEFVANGVLNSNCKFVTDEETLIEPMCLSRLQSVEPSFYTGQVRWYIEPIPNRSYLVGLDPSMGTGGDYAAIQVFMLPELIQVAEWQHNNTDTRGQVRTLLQILHTLREDLLDNPEQSGEPDIYWTVENNSLGEGVLQVIIDTGEDQFPGQMMSERRKRGKRHRFRKGLTTTAPSKLSACMRLKSLVESDRMVINSNQSLKELKNFIARGKSYSAKPGQYDDLVSALLLCIRMLDIVIATGAEDIDDLKDGIGMEEVFSDPMPVVL